MESCTQKPHIPASCPSISAQPSPRKSNRRNTTNFSFFVPHQCMARWVMGEPWAVRPGAGTEARLSPAPTGRFPRWHYNWCDLVPWVPRAFDARPNQQALTGLWHPGITNLPCCLPLDYLLRTTQPQLDNPLCTRWTPSGQLARFTLFLGEMHLPFSCLLGKDITRGSYR